MLEYPEVRTIAAQLKESVVGKRVVKVLPPTKEHKFCWFSGAAEEYDGKLAGARVRGVEGFGLFVEIGFDNGFALCFNDGVNVRWTETERAAKDYQLLIAFEGGSCLLFTVQMYGGIVLHRGDYDNEYYLKSRHAIPFEDARFEKYFDETFENSNKNLSVKALLATEQRFPGIGNGAAQDIMLGAGLHPKRKIGTLTDGEREALKQSVVSVLTEMREKGGRDTEKDLFGNVGGYRTQLSKLRKDKGCPRCGGEIVKEQYLGGAIYFCPHCQPPDAEKR